MAKLSQQNQRNNNNNNNIIVNPSRVITKVKRTRKTVPRDSPPQRSSIYRGVTRHRWTGRYEAHLWDKNCWNESQNKKGRQVYLGAYDDEEAAAHAYDLAALKYWGQDTILNFPVATYQKELKEMESQSREEYIGSLRRKSSGFSRGVSKYRGVARHHHNGRWEARIGRVFGNKYLYLGTYATQEEAAIAYDMAAIEYRGLNAVTNFDLSRYIKWLKPNNNNNNNNNPNINTTTTHDDPQQDSNINIINNHNLETLMINNPNTGLATSENSTTSTFQPPAPPPSSSSSASASAAVAATSALGLLLQSSKFKEMMEMTLAVECGPMSSTSTPESEPSGTHQCSSSVADELPTFFETQQDLGGYLDHGNEDIFGDLNPFVQPMLQFDFDA